MEESFFHRRMGLETDYEELEDFLDEED